MFIGFFFFSILLLFSPSGCQLHVCLYVGLFDIVLLVSEVVCFSSVLFCFCFVFWLRGIFRLWNFYSVFKFTELFFWLYPIFFYAYLVNF